MIRIIEIQWNNRFIVLRWNIEYTSDVMSFRNPREQMRRKRETTQVVDQIPEYDGVRRFYRFVSHCVFVQCEDGFEFTTEDERTHEGDFKTGFRRWRCLFGRLKIEKLKILKKRIAEAK